MRKRRILNKKKLILLISMLCFIILLFLSIVKIIAYLNDNKENKKIQKIVSEAVTIIPNEKRDKYEIDFKILKERNSDTVGYLKINNTNIDYVVVKGNDNSYYLNHNFNKKENVSGWIFADYHNKFDGNDKNIVIYGHNTWDGSMFGSLKNILDDNWYQNEDNHKILLATEDGIYYYQVFATYTIDVEDYYISTSFSNDLEFETFVKRLKFRSIYPYKVDVYKDDKILTLSTCNGDGKKRVVLHAKLINY